MIKRMGQLFILETAETSYIFKVLKSGHLQHLYYGRRVMIMDESDGEILAEKQAYLRGNTNAYDQDNPALTLEDICLEMSSLGKGDIRDPFISVLYADGSRTSDFIFEKAEISQGKEGMEFLPSSYDETDEVFHLTLTLRERHKGLILEMHYYTFESCDVISRRAKLYNASEETVQIERLMSIQLDFYQEDFVMTSFGGAWIREMKKTQTALKAGRHVNESLTGTTSSRANSFVMLHPENTDEDQGRCYGFHLIYSGNHYEAASVSSFGKIRFISGIHPEMFSWKLEPGEAFEAPEGCMTFSDKGMNKMSQNLHHFINEHIVRGVWKKKERPVLVNSWEAMYFNVTEKKLLSLAKAASETGAELFVLDDGWFGERKDDHRSLGDWQENTGKLPSGIKGLADKVKGLGLSFGIWVEPEMVNVDSELYRNHPDWSMDIPGREHSEGRNQRILDLSRSEVQDYVIESMSKVFSSADISYVKWDMNRNFTDIFSRALPADRQGEVLHRYYIGLYRIMKTLTESFPHILFEGCSSGGNRFDLGTLCYFPQIWASDDTDALARSEIQTNYSYGYPLSTLGCHVSSCPNHQTLRNTSLQTRFNVASFGVLGYECNLMDLSEKEKREIKSQIEFYKKYRAVYQYGSFYRGRSFGSKEGYCGVLARNDAHLTEWTVVAEDQKRALGMLLQQLAVPNSPSEIYYPKGLKEEIRYSFTNRRVPVDIMEYGELINTASPIHIKNGSVIHKIVAKRVKMEGESEDHEGSGSLMMSGIRLKPAFAANGLSDEVRHFPDFASRLYIMEESK